MNFKYDLSYDKKRQPGHSTLEKVNKFGLFKRQIIKDEGSRKIGTNKEIQDIFHKGQTLKNL
jgi:hypothetical protein